MKVLHVLDHSLPEVDGYAVRSAYVAKSQAAAGLQPSIVTSAAHESVGGVAEVFDGITYHRSLPKADLRVPFAREWRRVRSLSLRIAEVAREERSDLIHAHSPCLWGEAAARAAGALCLPFVYEVRGFWEDAAVDRKKTSPRSLRYRLSRGLETRVAKAAKAVVVIANPLGDDLVGRGIDPRKIFHVPNGADTARFRPQPTSVDLRNRLSLEGKFVVGFVGSLFVWEGVEDLVRAARGIVERMPNAILLIVGRGEQLASARALVEKTGLDQWVKLVGAVPHDEVADYYSVMDVVVYPRKSTRNTELVTPLKPLEAMSMGKTVLGSDVGGIRELVPDNAGRFFRAGDVADLVTKCVELGQDPESRARFGQRARQHVIKRHQWDSLTQRYIDLYGQITTRGMAPRTASKRLPVSVSSRAAARENV